MHALLSLAAFISSAAAQAAWTYTGCIAETPGRTLLGASISGNMTIEVCQEYCAAQDFPLAGVEYANECFCGATVLNNAPTTPNEECNMPCSANEAQICGGPNRLSVYTDTAYVPPAIVSAPAEGWTAQGCRSEGTTERTLGGGVLVDAVTMTPQVCVAHCQTGGFAYAGVEYGSECYCGNAVSNQTLVKPDAECNMKCAGNKKAYCGGADRLVLYSYTAA